MDNNKAGDNISEDLFYLFGTLVDLVHEFGEDSLLDANRFVDLVDQSSQFLEGLFFVGLVGFFNVQFNVKGLDLSFSFSVLLTIVFLKEHGGKM